MSLTLPAYEFRTRERDGMEWIYDAVREKYVRLTPEEWVRQHFVEYLVQEHSVPRGLVAVEMGVRVNGQPQRADVVVHARSGHPLLLVECKAPETDVTQTVFDQAARYNVVLGAPFLVVTNGRDHYACRLHVSTRTIDYLPALPDYEEMEAVMGGSSSGTD